MRENKLCQNVLLRNLNDKILNWPTFKIPTFHLPSKMTTMTINRNFIYCQKEIESAEFFQKQIIRSKIENQGSDYRIIGVASLSKLPKQWGWKLWIGFTNHIFFSVLFLYFVIQFFSIKYRLTIQNFSLYNFFFSHKRKWKVVALSHTFFGVNS